MFLVKVNSFTVFLMQVCCYWCVNRCDVRRYVGWKCIKLMEGYVVRFIVVLMNEYAYIEGEKEALRGHRRHDHKFVKR